MVPVSNITMANKNNKTTNNRRTRSQGSNGSTNASSRSSQSTRSRMTVATVPVSYGTIQRPIKPAFGRSSNGVTLYRREFVGSFTNGATVNAFTVTPLSLATPGYDINPSCQYLFPWLSRIAPCFERFRFNALSLHFVTSQATTTPGRYYAAVDYDYDDNPTTFKTEFMANVTAIEAPVWKESSLVLDPSCMNRDLPYRFVSCTSRGIPFEGRTQNAGFVMLALETSTANVLLDIWVEYSIELVTPVLDIPAIDDNIISGLTTMANVTTAHGTGFVGQLPLQASSSGKIPLVTPGTSGIPAMSCTIFGAALAITGAYDIYRASRDGALRFLKHFAVTGVAPDAIIGTNQPSSFTPIFDALGAFLGYAAVAGGSAFAIGPVNASELATVSKTVQILTDYPLITIFELFPTARYIATFIGSSVAALGAGYGRTSYFVSY